MLMHSYGWIDIEFMMDVNYMKNIYNYPFVENVASSSHFACNML